MINIMKHLKRMEDFLNEDHTSETQGVTPLKIDDTGSVLIRDNKTGMELWMDIMIDKGEVIVDWNKYIFIKTDPQDMKEQEFQQNADNFDNFSSEAINYAVEQGFIEETEDGTWKYGEGHSELNFNKKK